MMSSLVARLQRAAAQSPMVRGLLIGALAISVTVGGVLAGALVVAPVVGTVSPPTSAGSATASKAVASKSVASKSAASKSVASTSVSAQDVVSTPVSARITTIAKSAWTRAQALRARVLTDVPEPVRLYATPVLAAISIVSALAALFLRRQQPMRSLTPAGLPVAAAPRGLARLTPRSGSRAIGRSSGKSPKGSKAVEAMAASGASTQDIAWKTGLPFDAVQLLLSISTGPRQLQPPSA